MKHDFEMPVPAEGADYCTDTLNRYTVTIEACVTGLAESTSDEDACAKAVKMFRAGKLDGDTTVVNTEKIKDVKLFWDTDIPFDLAAWQKAKLLEMGVHADGTPLRPWEKGRPRCETKLSEFVVTLSWWSRALLYIKQKIRRLYTVPRKYPTYNYDMEKMLNETR